MPVISDHQFNNYMNAFLPLEDNPRIAVAISGGVDSLSLIFMLNRWIKPLNGEVVGITIDHRLRKESHGESLEVGKILAKWGIKHKIISWQHDGVETLKNISESSRINRYKLMENYCKENAILHLAIGHHLDDQLETMEMRKLRNAHSVKGMDATQYMTHVRIIRPFLHNVHKQDLIDTLNSHNITWIEDPSNHKLIYERNKIRHNLKNNLHITDVKSSYDHSNPDQASHDHLHDLKALDKQVYLDEFNHIQDIMLSTHAYAEIHIKSLDSIHHIKNILSSLIMTVGANFYKLSQSKILQACKDLSQEKNISLGHCLIVITQIQNKTNENSYKITISREIRAIKHKKITLNSLLQKNSTNPNNTILWNNTILIAMEHLQHHLEQYKNDSDCYISLLSQDNMKKANSIYEKTIFQDIPFNARKVLPCLFRSDELISVLTMENNTIYIPPRPVSGKKINVQYSYK